MLESEKDQRPRETLQENELCIQQRVDRAQQRAQRYVKSGVSLVDELIADRRKEAVREGCKP